MNEHTPRLEDSTEATGMIIESSAVDISIESQELTQVDEDVLDTTSVLARETATHESKAHFLNTKKGKLVLGGSGLGILGISAGLFMMLGNNREDTDPSLETAAKTEISAAPTPTTESTKPTTPEASATPEESSTPKTAEQLIRSPLDMPASIVELGTYENLTDGQQTWMQEVGNMTIDEFTKLSREDQVAFGNQVFDNLRVTVQAALRQHGTMISYTQNPTTAEQMMNNQVFYWITAGWCYERINNDFTNPPVFNELVSLSIIGLSREIDDETIRVWREQYGPAIENYDNRLIPTQMYDRMIRTIVEETSSDTGEITVTSQDIDGNYRMARLVSEDVHNIPDAHNPGTDPEIIGQHIYMEWFASDVEYEE